MPRLHRNLFLGWAAIFFLGTGCEQPVPESRQVAPLERIWRADALQEFCFRATPESVVRAFGPPDARLAENTWLYERIQIASADGATTTASGRPVRLHLHFSHVPETQSLQVREIKISP
jgi:hypothetical protein